MEEKSTRSSRGTKRTRRASMKSRSRSVAPRRLFAKRTYALAAPNVGLGASVTTVLRTSFFANVTAAATGVFTGYLKLGSVFDPTGDLAAIQPQMFDQFAAQYGRYLVNHASVKIKIHNPTAGIVYVAAAYPAVDSTALATFQAAASQQYCKTTSGNAYQVAYLSFNKINQNSIVGAKSDAYDSGALVTADPTANQYMVLPIFIQQSQAAATGWVLEIDILQNVTFSQKKNVVDA